MKKILLFILCMILLVTPLVSASDWDNKLSYSNEDLKVTIKNSILGLIPTSEIGTVELKSHSSVDEIKKVGAGSQVVMWYDFDFVELYSNGLGEVEFTDMRTGKLIDRDYSFVYWGEKERDVYDCEYSFSTNGTKVCNSVVVGKETYKTWLPYNSKDIPKGNIRIGLMTYVEIRDKIDGVWTIAGKKVKKHAVWTPSLNVDLISYYNFEEPTGDLIDQHGSNDGTNDGADYNATGIIDYGWEFELDNTDYVDLGNAFGFTDELTISIWFKTESLVANADLISKYTGEDFILYLGSPDGGKIHFTTFTPAQDLLNYVHGSLVGNWVHAVVVYNSTNLLLYVGGNFKLSVPASGNIDISANVIEIGRRLGGSSYFDGIIDEVGIWNRTLTPTEVTQLWNGGNGITYGTGMTIDLISPEDTSSFSTNIINFSANVSDPQLVGIQNVTLEVVYPNGTSFYNETNTTGFEGIYNWTEISILNGNWNWSVNAYDDDNNSYVSTMRVFLVDSLLPQINISYPNGQNFSYLTNLNNITLNTTITDTNLDTCWYEYNSTNTTFACSSGVLSENNLTINNESIIIVWANDTAKNTNSSTSGWNYDLFDFNNYTFDATITESSSTTFIGNFQIGTVISSTFLEYNNTNYSVSINSLGGNRYTLTSTLTSLSVSSDTNITWFFWVNNINATSQNQTIQNIDLDNCSSYTNYIVNYTLVDELTQVEINNSNSSIESLINLRTISGQSIAQFSETFTGDSTPTICSEVQLNETGLRFWEQSRYSSDDYVFEQNNIQNASMTSLPAEITLRDLPSASATTFRITYKSETFLAVPDAVINIQRKYIGEGIFKSIESPITDANGEVSASLDLNAVIYRIIVSENGITLSTFENPAIACDNILTGDCTININEKQTINLINTFDVINDFNYGLTQDNRTITLTFEIPSGASKDVNLFVNQSTILGNKTSCNQTSLATSGQIQCVIDPTLGDVFATIEVSSGGTQITTASTTIMEDRSQYFGTDNIVLTFFLVLSLVLLMVSDPIAVLIGIVIGLIAGGLMLFLNMGSLFGVTSILMYLIIIIILIIIKVSNRQR